MGFLYIIWSIDYGVGIYKIVKGDGNFPPGIEVISKFNFNNDDLAIMYLKKVLSKFSYNREFYKCSQEWLGMACQYVQRIVNRDEDIMDLELPWNF